MNKRQVIVLWIIALVLAATVGLVKLTTKDAASSATKRAPGQTLFESFPATDTAKIQIAGAGNSVTVQRKDAGWVVVERDDYPARLLMVNEFLRTLTDLKVTRGMEAGPSFAPRFGMDESSKNADDRGITATFHDAAGNELAKVSLGKNIENTGDSGMMGGSATVGRYIRNHADESGFYAINEMFPSITPDFPPWLDNAFISPEKIRAISLTEKGSDTVAWKVVRETEEAEFKLENPAPGEVLESSVAAPFKSLLSYARFEDVVPAAKVAEKSDGSAKRTAVIETFEGFTYRLDIAPVKGSADAVMMTVNVSATIAKERKVEEGESPEDAKAKSEAFTTRVASLEEKLTKEGKLNGRTFELSKSTVESLLKDRSEIVAKAEAPAPGEGAPGSVQQTPGGLIATPPVQAVTDPIAIPSGDE
jgi:hypothetical protein